MTGDSSFTNNKNHLFHEMILRYSIAKETPPEIVDGVMLREKSYVYAFTQSTAQSVPWRIQWMTKPGNESLTTCYKEFLALPRTINDGGGVQCEGHQQKIEGSITADKSETYAVSTAPTAISNFFCNRCNCSKATHGYVRPICRLCVKYGLHDLHYCFHRPILKAVNHNILRDFIPFPMDTTDADRELQGEISFTPRITPDCNKQAPGGYNPKKEFLVSNKYCDANKHKTAPAWLEEYVTWFTTRQVLLYAPHKEASNFVLKVSADVVHRELMLRDVELKFEASPAQELSMFIYILEREDLLEFSRRHYVDGAIQGSIFPTCTTHGTIRHVELMPYTVCNAVLCSNPDLSKSAKERVLRTLNDKANIIMGRVHSDRYENYFSLHPNENELLTKVPT
jgi:hypothetical protein